MPLVMCVYDCLVGPFLFASVSYCVALRPSQVSTKLQKPLRRSINLQVSESRHFSSLNISNTLHVSVALEKRVTEQWCAVQSFNSDSCYTSIYILQGARQGRGQGVAKATPQSPLRKKYKAKNVFYLQHSHRTLNCTQSFSGGEAPCLMMLTIQIHRSDTPSIDAVIDRFATTAARRLDFLIWTYTCTSVHCTVQ